MKEKWNSRIVQTQPLMMYPVFISSYPPEIISNKQIIFLIIIISFVFLLTNRIFIRDAIEIFKTKSSSKSLAGEYVWIFIVGCTNIYIFSCIYHLLGIQFGGEIIQRDWQASIYFSIVTWTTLGYGDFSPIESLRLVAATEAMIGYIYMAVLVGILLSFSSRINDHRC